MKWQNSQCMSLELCRAMGLCESSEQRYQRLQNEVIEKQLLESRKQLYTTQKLLLLGAAECGKSTILKQMRIIHDNGFTVEEIEAQRKVIRANILEAMAAMLIEKDSLGIVPTNKQTEINARIIHEEVKLIEDETQDGALFSETVYKALKALWADKAIQEVYRRRNEYQLPDCTKYFLGDLDRIAAEDFVPNNQDVLYTRVQTSGVNETKFTVKKTMFRVFDVGGQRSERRKWIHCFDNVNAVIFICAISEFDQKLKENNETNRLLESLALFRQICNNEYFATGCSMILFLNKKDLFAEKIKTTSIAVAFSTYKGADTYAAQIGFIQEMFKKQNENPTKKIYIHHTCATDTNQVQVVLESVADTVIRNNVSKAGLT